MPIQCNGAQHQIGVSRVIGTLHKTRRCSPAFGRGIWRPGHSLSNDLPGRQVARTEVSVFSWVSFGRTLSADSRRGLLCSLFSVLRCAGGPFVVLVSCISPSFVGLAASTAQLPCERVPVPDQQPPARCGRSCHVTQPHSPTQVPSGEKMMVKVGARPPVFCNEMQGLCQAQRQRKGDHATAVTHVAIRHCAFCGGGSRANCRPFVWSIPEHRSDYEQHRDSFLKVVGRNMGERPDGSGRRS